MIEREDVHEQREFQVAWPVGEVRATNASLKLVFVVSFFATFLDKQKSK